MNHYYVLNIFLILSNLSSNSFKFLIASLYVELFKVVLSSKNCFIFSIRIGLFSISL